MNVRVGCQFLNAGNFANAILQIHIVRVKLFSVATISFRLAICIKFIAGHHTTEFEAITFNCPYIQCTHTRARAINTKASRIGNESEFE